MNEAIKNLVIQAHNESERTAQEYHSQGASASDFFPEILSKLIVKECANLFDKNETDVRIPEYRAHDSIMIHFGLY